jgi:hypothetical protein
MKSKKEVNFRNVVPLSLCMMHGRPLKKMPVRSVDKGTIQYRLWLSFSKALVVVRERRLPALQAAILSM